MKRFLRLVSAWMLLCLPAVMLGGCGDVLFWRTQRHQNTSVVEYLYPDATDPVMPQGIPVLNLPMRVGLAFVPDGDQQEWLTATKKAELLERVAQHFRSLDYVKAIEIIPSDYLTRKGGFQNLDQIRAMYRVETIALVSYDQKQFNDKGLASLTYWTLVGAYVVPAEKNSTHTMVDTAVMHIPSRRMLFRAPGVSVVKGASTLVNQSEQIRADSERGFDDAIARMIGNLDTQLVAFQERVKTSPEEYKIARAAGSQGARGGGDFGIWAGAAFALLMAGGAWWSSKR